MIDYIQFHKDRLDEHGSGWRTGLGLGGDLNAIFYYSEFQDLQDQENQFVLAGINRMRPIAMTTFAAVLALLPLALGIGQGSSMLKPLAIAIVSGLVFQLPLVLIVLPCLLALFRQGPRGARRNTRVVPPLVSSAR